MPRGLVPTDRLCHRHGIVRQVYELRMGLADLFCDAVDRQNLPRGGRPCRIYFPFAFNGLPSTAIVFVRKRLKASLAMAIKS